MCHGRRARAREFGRHAGLDVLAHLGAGIASDVDRAAIVESLVELNRIVAPEVAALAASRRGPMEGVLMTGLVVAMTNSDQLAERRRLGSEIWDLTAEAAESMAVRLLNNSLRAAISPHLHDRPELVPIGPHQVAGYRDLVSAMLLGDPTAARDAARTVTSSDGQPLTTSAIQQAHHVRGRSIPQPPPQAARRYARNNQAQVTTSANAKLNAAAVSPPTI